MTSHQIHSLASTDFVSGILSGNRVILSRAITLLESTKPEHQLLAEEILSACIVHSGKSIRIGITGVPGVGKSTFIESFGNYLVTQNRKLAVLAIDPSSSRSKGSILGDKVRMETLSQHEHVFIRPSPSSGTLGGVAKATRESILLCEAAGFDTILIETVGVGQSEITVHSMVDFFLLLQITGAGDELQGMKRGIMEMADSIVITKADGNNIERARLTKQEYENALHLFPATESGWMPKVHVCSAISGDGISEVWKTILAYFELTQSNLSFDKKRKNQAILWMNQTIEESIKHQLYSSEKVKLKLHEIESQVESGILSPHAAAQILLAIYFEH